MLQGLSRCAVFGLVPGTGKTYLLQQAFPDALFVTSTHKLRIDEYEKKGLKAIT
jgi:hypothetical protein